MPAGALGASAEDPVKRMPYLGFAVVVIVYLAIIQLGGLMMSQVSHVRGDDGFRSVHNVLVTVWIPLGAALVFTYAVVTVLGWWGPVMHDDRPVNPWVWVVPVVFLVGIAGAIDYSTLSDKGLGFTLVLLVATQLVGWGEEGMFRGIGVTVLRTHGLREGQVALWSSLVFGAVHLTNALGHGTRAIPQAIAVSLAGYFFYLIRRVSRGNVVNSVIHGLFDFSLVSGTAVLADHTYVASVSGVAVYVVLAVVVLVGRHQIEPAPPP